MSLRFDETFVVRYEPITAKKFSQRCICNHGNQIWKWVDEQDENGDVQLLSHKQRTTKTMTLPEMIECTGIDDFYYTPLEYTTCVKCKVSKIQAMTYVEHETYSKPIDPALLWMLCERMTMCKVTEGNTGMPSADGEAMDEYPALLQMICDKMAACRLTAKSKIPVWTKMRTSVPMIIEKSIRAKMVEPVWTAEVPMSTEMAVITTTLLRTTPEVPKIATKHTPAVKAILASEKSKIPTKSKIPIKSKIPVMTNAPKKPAETVADVPVKTNSPDVAETTNTAEAPKTTKRPSDAEEPTVTETPKKMRNTPVATVEIPVTSPDVAETTNTAEAPKTTKRPSDAEEPTVTETPKKMKNTPVVTVEIPVTIKCPDVTETTNTAEAPKTTKRSCDAEKPNTTTDVSKITKRHKMTDPLDVEVIKHDIHTADGTR